LYYFLKKVKILKIQKKHFLWVFLGVFWGFFGWFFYCQSWTQGMRRPCVMDIKIGARTYGPDASPAKVRQEDAKYLGTKKPLGMQRRYFLIFKERKESIPMNRFCQPM
jgi:hypothetical protein